MSSVSDTYSFHVQKGMMEGFELDWLSGVDCAPRELLAGLSLDEPFALARERLKTNALGLLRAQVSQGGSTLFVIMDKLVEHNESALVALIAERRANEIRDAVITERDDFVDVSDLMLTAYGLSLLEAMHIDSSVIPRSVSDQISQELREAGFRVRVVKPSQAGHVQSGIKKRSKSLLKFVLQDRAFEHAE
jgi:hypothetical protein